jgi:hypothetical protein
MLFDLTATKALRQFPAFHSNNPPAHAYNFNFVYNPLFYNPLCMFFMQHLGKSVLGDDLMKKIAALLLFLFFFPLNIALSEPNFSRTSDLNNRLIISQNARQRALEKRGEKIVTIKDSLVRNTIRAYGGDYFSDGKMISIRFDGKIYKNFTFRIVRGKYLIIHTPDGVIYLEVVNE